MDRYTVNIPIWNKTKFEKYIKTLKRKGLDIDYKDLGKILQRVNDIDYMCNIYEIVGKKLYQINGWTFVGVLEHKDSGNIIRKIIDVDVPIYYETAPNECEHCYTVRNRIDTYLVMGPEGEFKQVGKSCLKAYTGLDPAVCFMAMNLENEIAKFEIDEEEVAVGGYNSFGTYRGYNAYIVKKIAYADIVKRGYRKITEENMSGEMIPSSKDFVIDSYATIDPEVATDDEIKEVDNWVANLDTKYSDYFRNAKVAYEAEYYEPRDLTLVISLISCFFKDKLKQAEKAAKDQARQQSADGSQIAGYLGRVGDKVEFDVQNDFIIFMNEPYVYGGSYSYTHKIIDSQGHVILWTTSQDKPFEIGTVISATIKSCKEFRGELQTTVTRGKII